MSSIPTKHFDGDASIGRNISAGGNANIQGNVRVGHNLKVEGWLDAPNIKGSEKGMFESADYLMFSYPHPEDGWWALVGTSLPADIYVARDGVWRPTGAKGGEIIVDASDTGVHNVVFFDEVDVVNALNVPNEDMTATLNRTDYAPADAPIVMTWRDSRFFAKVGDVFYEKFPGSKQFGAQDGKGIAPKPGILYVSKSGSERGRLFVYSDSGGWNHLEQVELDLRQRVVALENKKVPTAQTTVSGTPLNYVYSTGNKSLDSVMSAGSSGLLQNGGALIFRAHLWNPQGLAGKYFSTPVPCAGTGSNGAMSKEVFNRLGTGASIYESTASANSVTISYPNWATGGNRTFKLNAATTARAGLMSQTDKVKLNNAGVYAIDGANRKALNGVASLFSLTTASTDAEIKAALTDYQIEDNVLTIDDLAYCAKYGCMLYNPHTHGFVQVMGSTSGFGYFNFIEISSPSYLYKPSVRFVCIQAKSDGTFRVTRDGTEIEICYQSELDALTARVDTLDNADRIRIFDKIVTPDADGAFPEPEEGTAVGSIALLIDIDNSSHQVCVCTADGDWAPVTDVTDNTPLRQDGRVVFDSDLGHYCIAPGVIFFVENNVDSSGHVTDLPIAGYYIENPNALGYVSRIATSDTDDVVFFDEVDMSTNADVTLTEDGQPATAPAGSYKVVLLWRDRCFYARDTYGNYYSNFATAGNYALKSGVLYVSKSGSTVGRLFVYSDSDNGKHLEQVELDLRQRVVSLENNKADKNSVPTPQAVVYGSNKNYVYSTGNKSLDSVMSAGSTGLLQNGGALIFRAHLWNPLRLAGQYFSTPVPCANAGNDGAMSKEVFNRLGTGASIYESTASANSVPISYPNWATGGNRTFTLNAATTARAGVMTASDKKALDNADRIRTFDAVLTPYAATGSYPTPVEVDNYFPYMLAILIDAGRIHKVCVNINNTWVALEEITEIDPDLRDDRVVFDANLGHYRIAPTVIFWLSGDNSFGESFGFITGYYVENQSSPGYVTKIITEVNLYDVADNKASKSELNAAKTEVFNDQWTAWGGTIAIGQYTKFGVTMDYAKAVRIYGMHEFIDVWNETCGGYGRYNAATEYFELNGINDIGIDEAREIFHYAQYPRAMASLNESVAVRTNLLALTDITNLYDRREDCSYLYRGPHLQTIRIGLDGMYSMHPSDVYKMIACTNVHTIYGWLDLASAKNTDNMLSAPELITFKFTRLRSNLNLGSSPKVSYDSMNFLVTHADNTAVITITVHADVYAKLIGDTSNAAAAALTPEEAIQWQQLLIDANDKQIAFLTA